MEPLARFDDLISGSALDFRNFQRALVARNPDEVMPVLAEVEEAVASGAWAAGFVGYEASGGLDPSITVHPGPPGIDELPLVWFGLFARRETCAPLAPRALRPAPYSVSTWTPSISRDSYEAALAAIRDHIAAGDTYQVNHSFRLRAAFSGDAFELYRDVALSQRGGYAAYLDLGRHQVVSASPELFFRRDHDVLTTRPMKGTIARGRWPEEDDLRAQTLTASTKDQAENLIIVDLLRNDMGRVAEFGTVIVQRLFELERYETVWQLTSTITGTVPETVGFGQVLGALFPCGSITGAPKLRTMEIIAGLEDSPRGVYCGTIGYLAPPGSPGPSARFSVAIRTVTIDGDEGVAEYGLGGGITWDSSPAGEYDEARAKAQVLVQRRPEFDLLESLRFEPGTGFARLDLHLERMAASARYFGFVWDEGAARAALDLAVRDVEEGVWKVRLLAPRSGPPHAEAAPLGPEPEDAMSLAIDDEPISSSNVFLFHKTTHRREYEERSARHPEADDVVLVNERGEVTETTTGNLAVRLAGNWYTPPVDSGCLPGVYRRALLSEGRLRERTVTVSELVSATEIGVLNSVRSWRSARLLGAPVAPAPPGGGEAGLRVVR